MSLTNMIAKHIFRKAVTEVTLDVFLNHLEEDIDLRMGLYKNLDQVMNLYSDGHVEEAKELLHACEKVYQKINDEEIKLRKSSTLSYEYEDMTMNDYEIEVTLKFSDVYKTMGMKKEAIKVLKRIVETSHIPEAYKKLIGLLEAEGKQKEADKYKLLSEVIDS